MPGSSALSQRQDISEAAWLRQLQKMQTLFWKVKARTMSDWGRDGWALPQKPSAVQDKICTFPSNAVWVARPFFPRPRGHSFANIRTHLANHLYHIFLRKRTDSSRHHYPLHLPFPHLKDLQFLKLLSVICVVFILASLKMSCQTIALGNSVVFFPHRVTLFFFYFLPPTGCHWSLTEAWNDLMGFLRQ